MTSYLFRIAVGTAIVASCMGFAQRAQAQLPETYCPQPTATNCTPCKLFDELIKLTQGSLLGGALDDSVKAFVNLLSKNIADIDGTFSIDDSGEALRAFLSGDDMRDVSNQMAVLDYIIRNPSQFPAGSPIPAADLVAAFNANRATLEAKIGPDTLALMRLVLKPVPGALTYYTLLGKQSDFANIVSADPIVTNGSGTLGFIEALFVLLSGVEISEGQFLTFADTNIDPSEFVLFGELLGSDGDLDGDGFSNLCEYRHFSRSLCTPDTAFTNIAPAVDTTKTFVQAVLDPNIKPIGCYEVLAPEDDCSIEMSGDQVVPPSGSEAIGNVRYRRFENTVTGAERYQINYFHTVETVKPSAVIRKGLPGQAGSEVYINIPDASPQWWEYYVPNNIAATLKNNPNHISIFGTDPPAEGQPPVTTEHIRGDNSCGVLAPPPPTPHDADLNDNFQIEVSEILVVIEFINAGGFGCGPNFTYVPGSADQTCAPHNSDYNPQDWQITLPELLRLVQLFSAGSYEECIGGSEDGYCPVVN